MSGEENKPRKRRFKSCVECCFGFEGDRAVEFKRLMDWLIGLADGIGHYGSSVIPLLLHPSSVEVKFLDWDRILLPHVVLRKADMDNFWFGGNANKRFSFPAEVVLPAKKLEYIIEGVGRDSRLDFVFKLRYETWASVKRVEVRKPETCPKCGKYTVNNQLPFNKRGKRGDRYKCVCGWRGKVRVKTRKVKVYESQILDDSLVEVEVGGDGKERFEVSPLTSSIAEDRPAVVPQIKFTGKVKVLRSEFIKKLRRVKKLSDIAVFEAKLGSLTLTVKEEEIKTARFELDSSTLLDCQGRAKSAYNVARMIQAIPPIGTATTLQFANEMPILMSASPEHLVSSITECWQAPVIFED